MKRKLPLLLGAITALLFTTVAFSASAVDYLPGTDNDPTGQLSTEGVDGLDLGTTSAIKVTFDLINIALSLLATVSLTLLLYGGFLWIWGRGNQETITKAKDILKGTIIGMVIILASLGITTFVFEQVAEITGANVEVETETE